MGRIQNTIAIPIYRVLPYPVICSVYRCSQLESAIPMVSGDMDHTYSTILDIGSTNNQQRYSVYKIL